MYVCGGAWAIVTQCVFLCRYACLGLFEVHKLLFSFQMYSKVLEVAGKLSMDEYNFFLQGGLVRKHRTHMNIYYLLYLIWDIQQDTTFYLKHGTCLITQRTFHCVFKCWAILKLSFPSKTTCLPELATAIGRFTTSVQNASNYLCSPVNFLTCLGQVCYCIIDLLVGLLLVHWWKKSLIPDKLMGVILGT